MVVILARWRNGLVPTMYPVYEVPFTGETIR